MSDFLLNLARRGAGLGSNVSIEPSSDPVFSPTPGDVETGPRYEESFEDAQPARQPAMITGDQRDIVEQPQRAVVESSEPGLKEKKTTSTDNTQIIQNQSRGTTVHPRSALSPLDITIPSISPAAGTPLEPRAEGVDPAAAPPQTKVSSDQNVETSTSMRPVVVHAVRSIAFEQGSYTQSTTPARQAVTPSLNELQSNRIMPRNEEAPTITIEPVSTVMDSGASLSGIHQQPVPQPIHVRIGTIEVRAEQQPLVQAPKTVSQPPKRGFDDYKFIR